MADYFKISADRLLGTKETYEYPKILRKMVKLMNVENQNCASTMKPVGSASQIVQPYYSDVDVMTVSKCTSLADMVKTIQKTVVDVMNASDVFFSDFKAGGVHWTADELLQGYKGPLTLTKALAMKGVVKIDIFFNFDDRWIEGSTFFLIKAQDGSNYDESYFENIQQNIAEDGLHYWENNKFKATKRAWSIARITKSMDVLRLLQPLVTGSVQGLSQIKSDFETLLLMFEKIPPAQLPYESIYQELDEIHDRLSALNDIEFYRQIIDVSIDAIDLKDLEQSTIILETLNDYIQKIVNMITVGYLEYVNFDLKKYLETWVDSNATESKSHSH